jgi:hypothetical protein
MTVLTDLHGQIVSQADYFSPTLLSITITNIGGHVKSNTMIGRWFQPEKQADLSSIRRPT